MKFIDYDFLGVPSKYEYIGSPMFMPGIIKNFFNSEN